MSPLAARSEPGRAPPPGPRVYKEVRDGFICSCADVAAEEEATWRLLAGEAGAGAAPLPLVV